MNRNKSFNYLIYLVLITGLLFRYIKALEQGQQTGFDSWNYHQLIYQISVDGNINWNLNFLSFWGFYPPYAEMGGIILRTIFLLLTDLPIDISVVIFSSCYSFLSFFSMFILSNKLFKNKWISLYCSSGFYLSNYIVNGTVWIIHLRSDLAIFIPLLIYCLLEFFSNRSIKILIISIVMLVITFSLHTSSIFFGTTFIAFFILYLFDALFKYNVVPKTKPNFIKYTLVLLFFGILGLASYFEIFFNYSYSTVTQDLVNYDSDYKAIMFLFKKYARLIGLGVIFLPIGLYYLYANKDNFNTRLIWFLWITYLFFSVDYIYAMNYFSFILFLIIGLGIAQFAKSLPQGNIFRVFIIFLIISINIVPHFVTVDDSRVSNSWGSEILLKTNLVNNSPSTGLYLSSFCNPQIVVGYGVNYDEVKAYSKGPFFSDEDMVDIEERTYLESLSFFLEDGKFFSIYEYSLNLHNYDVDDDRLMSSIKDENYFVIANVYFKEQREENRIGDSKLIGTTMSDTYHIYSTDTLEIYQINYGETHCK